MSFLVTYPGIQSLTSLFRSDFHCSTPRPLRLTIFIINFGIILKLPPDASCRRIARPSGTSIPQAQHLPASLLRHWQALFCCQKNNCVNFKHQIPLLLDFSNIIGAGYLSQEKLELPNYGYKNPGQRVLARRKELRLTQREAARSLELLTSQFHNGKETKPSQWKTIVCFSGCSEVLTYMANVGDEDKAPVPAQELHVETELTPTTKN